MEGNILTRMGDGERVWLSAFDVRKDIEDGTEDAAKRGNIAPLHTEDQKRLFHIIADPSRMVSVRPGEEVIVTDDGCSMSFYSGQDSGGIGVPMSRMQAVLTYERACGADTTSMGHSDYSFKPVKSVVSTEMNDYYAISMVSTAPFFYGAQPNMGLYFQPDGPCPNPSELLARGDIAGALAAQEDAAQRLTKDLVFVVRKLAGVGCEGINLDTAGSAGDADFLAALEAVSVIKKELPDLPVVLGASGEFVIGMHGGVQFNHQRLAGMYPHQQVKAAEAAGADIFGLAIGTNTRKSVAWNLSRSITFLKQTVAEARIPVHANVGMGVCGIPMMEQPPIDSVTRVAKSLVQIGKADGL